VGHNPSGGGPLPVPGAVPGVGALLQSHMVQEGDLAGPDECACQLGLYVLSSREHCVCEHDWVVASSGRRHFMVLGAVPAFCQGQMMEGFESWAAHCV
jgi:hypothetical protein